MTNTRLLQGEMAKHGDTIESLANYLNRSIRATQGKIHNKTKFDQSEIRAIKIRYTLSNEAVCDIFFAE